MGLRLGADDEDLALVPRVVVLGHGLAHLALCEAQAQWATRAVAVGGGDHGASFSPIGRRVHAAVGIGHGRFTSLFVCRHTTSSGDVASMLGPCPTSINLGPPWVPTLAGLAAKLEELFLLLPPVGLVQLVVVEAQARVHVRSLGPFGEVLPDFHHRWMVVRQEVPWRVQGPLAPPEPPPLPKRPSP